MAVLEAEHLKKEYITKRPFGKKMKVCALNDVSFALEPGKCLGIVGESGCGKSTLCRMIGGVEQADSGLVYLNGNPINKKDNSFWRSKIQMVFQNSLDAVDPRYTAADILAEPLVNFTDLKGEKLMSRMKELMEQVGLPADDLSKKGSQFSGGQLQRICIARALAVHPEVIILDEPLSSLDVSVQAQILNLLRKIKEETEVSYVIISHDMEAVYYLTDSLIVMYAGQVVETLEDIRDINTLSHPYSKHLMMPFEARGNIEQAGLIKQDSNEEKKGCCFANRCTTAEKECFEGEIEFCDFAKGHKVKCLKVKKEGETLL